MVMFVRVILRRILFVILIDGSSIDLFAEQGIEHFLNVKPRLKVNNGHVRCIHI